MGEGLINAAPSQRSHRGLLTKSNSVLIGTLPLGSHRPVRIQSLTNTDTNDTTWLAVAGV